MNIIWIAGPLVGALIGYCTNYIAVKMLFRPRKAVYFGKVKLPFTPGIIPKRKPKLATAIGNAIENNLIKEDSLREVLLSNATKEKIRENIRTVFSDMNNSNTSISDLIQKYIGEEKYYLIRGNLEKTTTERVVSKIEEVDFGMVISQRVILGIKEKVQGTFFEAMISEDLIQSFVGPIANKINEYIQKSGPEIICEKIHDEIQRLEDENVSSLKEKADQQGIKIESIVLNIYEQFVNKKLANMIQTLELSKLVEKEINMMDMVELEALIFSVMKKELNAIIYLGGLIGFILGCLMLIF